MKKTLISAILIALILPLSADVVKESQAKREVDDAVEALAGMDARQELSTYLPQKEAYSARTYANKAQRFLKEGEYDKASFYAVLSTNYSKISIAKGLMAKAEKDKLESMLQAKQLETVLPRLKSAGLKQKGSTPFFAGTFDLKTLYGNKKVPAVDAIPDLTADMLTRVNEISTVLVEQPEIKVIISAKGKSEDHAAKYADSIKNVMVEKQVAAERITINTKKAKDSLELTLEGVKTK